MEVNNYETAINALLRENKGVLPALATIVSVALSGELPGSVIRLTVAELLALALVEISAEPALAEPVAAPPVAVAVGARVKMPAELHHSGPVGLADLLERAIVSVN